ncbi:CHRD domain-containing protein [Leptolyngbyaceae cyanobacterium UHCC 1019]
MKQLLALGFLSAATVLSPVAVEAATFNYSVPLEAKQEVAPNFSDSSATASATGALVGDPMNWVFSYVVNYSSLEGFLADGHIHLGDRGTNGPVVHILDNLPSFLGTQSGTIVGDWTSADVVAAGRTTPQNVFSSFLDGGYYFNLHSTLFPGGEVRGQIEPFVEASAVPEPTTMTGVLIAGAVGAAVRRKKNRQEKLKVEN